MTRSSPLLLTLVALLAWAAAATGALAEPRTAKAAGRFYPQTRNELLELVSELLERQPEPAISRKPRILIVPHAGYQYSGLVAANGFRQLQGHAYDGVVVVGFTHRLQFDGSSVDTRESYQTPLGELPIHQEAVAILQAYPGITYAEEAHESDEHSMEVELPFLQVAMDHVRIVPVLMGNDSLQDAARLAEALAGLARTGDYLFIFSTDLSHYHPYDEAQTLDETTVNAILGETQQAVHRLFAQGKLEACGRGPILASLFLAAQLGYPKREVLSYANSGDTAGNPSSVVGYAAIGMFDRPSVLGTVLSPEAGNALVQAARVVLETRLDPSKDQPRPAPLGLERFPELAQARGIFVTLRKRGELRGCIGRIETDESLAAALPAVALDAARRDSRFPPVSADELPELRLEVSVLTPPVPLKDPKELVAGRDGVVLESNGHHGVFLPQVWDETGWTRVEFLRELASQKAGLAPDAWWHASLWTFQDQIFQEEK